MYLFLSFLIIALLVFVTLNKKFSKFRLQNQDFFNLILTIAATFIGVFLAITLSNKSEITKERKNVIKLIDATSIALNNSISKSSAVYNVGKIANDTIFSPISNAINNPIRLPSLYFSLENNDLILRHFSSQGLNNYVFNIEGIITVKQAIDESIKKKNAENIYYNIELYIKQLYFSKRILSVERAVLNGDISENQIDDYYKKYRKELIGFDNNDLMNMINNK